MLPARADAQRSGVAQEAANAAAKGATRIKGSGITVDEARMILQVEPGASWGEVVKVRWPSRRWVEEGGWDAGSFSHVLALCWWPRSGTST